MMDIEFDGFIDDMFDLLDEASDSIDISFDPNTFTKTKKQMSRAPKKVTSKLSKAASQSGRSSVKKFDDLHQHEDPIVEPAKPKKKEMVVHEYRDLNTKKGSFEVPKSI
jgi:hypothetical protein